MYIHVVRTIRRDADNGKAYQQINSNDSFTDYYTARAELFTDE